MNTLANGSDSKKQTNKLMKKTGAKRSCLYIYIKTVQKVLVFTWLSPPTIRCRNGSFSIYGSYFLQCYFPITSW